MLWNKNMFALLTTRVPSYHEGQPHGTKEGGQALVNMDRVAYARPYGGEFVRLFFDGDSYLDVSGDLSHIQRIVGSGGPRPAAVVTREAR